MYTNNVYNYNYFLLMSEEDADRTDTTIYIIISAMYMNIKNYSYVRSYVYLVTCS